MGFARIDWTSDYVVFFGAVLIVAIVLVIALDRYSPQRKVRRRVDRHHRDRAGELID